MMTVNVSHQIAEWLIGWQSRNLVLSQHLKQ
jgi:hypothetical protein